MGQIQNIPQDYTGIQSHPIVNACIDQVNENTSSVDSLIIRADNLETTKLNANAPQLQRIPSQPLEYNMVWATQPPPQLGGLIAPPTADWRQLPQSGGGGSELTDILHISNLDFVPYEMFLTSKFIPFTFSYDDNSGVSVFPIIYTGSGHYVYNF
jgi:hypothetical protein